MANDSWETPQWLFDFAKERYGDFSLDVCAAHGTNKCAKYYTIAENSLIQAWDTLNWCNPPYSDIRPWVEKAALEVNLGNRTVMLLPADFSTKWFKMVWDLASEVLIINKRVSFVGASASPKFASFLCLISPEAWNLESPHVDLICSKALL